MYKSFYIYILFYAFKLLFPIGYEPSESLNYAMFLLLLLLFLAGTNYLKLLYVPFKFLIRVFLELEFTFFFGLD